MAGERLHRQIDLRLVETAEAISSFDLDAPFQRIQAVFATDPVRGDASAFLATAELVFPGVIEAIEQQRVNKNAVPAVKWKPVPLPFGRL